MWRFINDCFWIKKNIAVLNVDEVLWGISENEAVKTLNSFMLEDNGANKTPVEVIKESAFGVDEWCR